MEATIPIAAVMVTAVLDVDGEGRVLLVLAPLLLLVLFHRAAGTTRSGRFVRLRLRRDDADADGASIRERRRAEAAIEFMVLSSMQLITIQPDERV